MQSLIGMGADEQARTGWYIPAAYDIIREMIKIKYVYVRDNNEPAPDSICYDLMQAIEDTVVAGHTAEKDKDKNTAGEAGGEDEVSFVSDCVRKLTFRREVWMCRNDTQNLPRPRKQSSRACPVRCVRTSEKACT